MSMTTTRRDDSSTSVRVRARARSGQAGGGGGSCSCLLVIVVVVIATLPTIVAKTPLRNMLIASALPAGSVRVTVADASLGWFSAPALTGIEISDAAGAKLATVESIRTNRSPLALASNLA